jgi:hypothetical protein
MKMTPPWAAVAASVVKRRRPAALVGLHHRCQAWLVDRDHAAFEAFDLGCIDVDADHVVTDLGQAGTTDQANVACTEDANAHAGNPFLKKKRGTHPEDTSPLGRRSYLAPGLTISSSSTSNTSGWFGPIVGGACSP